MKIIHESFNASGQDVDVHQFFKTRGGGSWEAVVHVDTSYHKQSHAELRKLSGVKFTPVIQLQYWEMDAFTAEERPSKRDTLKLDVAKMVRIARELGIIME